MNRLNHQVDHRIAKFLASLTLILVFVFTFTAIAPTHLSAAPNKILLEYKYKMGDVISYNVDIDSTTSMKTTKSEAAETVKVKIAFDQNILYIEDERIDLQMVVNSADAVTESGKTVDLSQQVGKTVYTTMKRNGEVLGMTSFDKNFDPNQMSVPFPDEPIAPGFSWTRDIKASDQIPVPIQAKYTLNKFSVYKGYKVAIIDEEILVPQSEQQKGIVARSKGKLYFDYEKGLIVRNHLRTQLTMTQSLRNDDPKLGPDTKVVVTKVKMTTVMELAK